MRERGYGHIINIASTGAYTVSPTAAVYCASSLPCALFRTTATGDRRDPGDAGQPGGSSQNLPDHITDETARTAMRANSGASPYLRSPWRRQSPMPSNNPLALISANSSSALWPVLINRKHVFIYSGYFMSESGSFSGAMPFAGRVAIVTGAASGIGSATVELLHRQALVSSQLAGDNVNALNT